jgi:type VI protein secretion system component VasK
MTLFNEVNCRKLFGEINVFKNIFANAWFLGIWVVTVVLQVVLCQYGSRAFRCLEGGLNAEQWGWCLALGAFTLVWQLVINLARRVAAIDFRPKRKQRPLKTTKDAMVVHCSGDLRHVLSGDVRSLASTSGDLRKVLSGRHQANLLAVADAGHKLRV